MICIKFNLVCVLKHSWQNNLELNVQPKPSFVNPDVFRGVTDTTAPLWFLRPHFQGHLCWFVAQVLQLRGPFIGRLTYIHLTAVSALLSSLCCFRFFKVGLSVQGRWKGMREQDLWIKGVIINIQEPCLTLCCTAVAPSLCLFIFAQQVIVPQVITVMTWNSTFPVVYWQTQFMFSKAIHLHLKPGFFSWKQSF